MNDSGYLQKVFAVLGDPSPVSRDPSMWKDLEEYLGFILPGDFKEIAEAYAPVRLNGHLYLLHPTTERWNLKEEIAADIEALGDLDWDEVEGDPRPSLGIERMEFGTRTGLTPIVSADSGQTVFLANSPHGCGWRILIEDGDGEFFEYAMGFSEWLYRYLAGEDVFGPNSSYFYPGPVALQDLPMSPSDHPMTRYGPPRDGTL
ncbi:SMI1/KNR4 family protein [Streptomyces sp. SM11]|uniref:SMI1/KNR4 family protein n=1 Tax=Streptomyces sp. SM11 TaxID=565557 RepID=UPI00215655AF|nr:SMI1/KNR4 family protein [Streptomyces sp. SM11]